MSMTMSPARVAQARATRLANEQASTIVRYSTTTGDAPRTATAGEIERAKRAKAEIDQILADAGPLGCCFECDMGPEATANLDRLWRIVEAAQH